MPLETVAHTAVVVVVADMPLLVASALTHSHPQHLPTLPGERQERTPLLRLFVEAQVVQTPEAAVREGLPLPLESQQALAVLACPY